MYLSRLKLFENRGKFGASSFIIGRTRGSVAWELGELPSTISVRLNLPLERTLDDRCNVHSGVTLWFPSRCGDTIGKVSTE